MSPFRGILSEQVLVHQCLADDPLAWGQLYHAYRVGMRCSIRRLLHLPPGGDPQRVDEVEAGVWDGLLRCGRRRLRAYDAGRGSLAVYLAALAKDEVRHQHRARQREHSHETPLRREPADPGAGGRAIECMLEEALPLLTPQVANFCRACLAQDTEEAMLSPFSPANARKLKQRARHALHALCEDR